MASHERWLNYSPAIIKGAQGARVCVFVCECVCVKCVCVCIHVYVCVCMMYVCAYVCAYVCLCVYANISRALFSFMLTSWNLWQYSGSQKTLKHT